MTRLTIFLLILSSALLGALVWQLVGRTAAPAGGRLLCWVRRLVRRGSWYYLFPLVVLAYPYFYNFLIYLEIRGLRSQDVVDAAAAAAAKMVDPVQFYSKSLVAVSNFCLINALGWASLLVVTVLVDWATGHYSKPENYQAVGLDKPVFGFKRTFLSLEGVWRIGFYILVWAIELGIAAHSVESAFRMQ
jgi:hypothetical protein